MGSSSETQRCKSRTDRSQNVSAIELTDGQKIQSCGKNTNPGRTPNRMKQQIGHMGVWLEHCRGQSHDQRHTKNQYRRSHRLAKPGITLACRTPNANAGKATRNPTKGPEAPTSNSARVDRIGERIMMNAPNVPISVGAGIKNG